jgi:hypothetical protein
MYELTKATTTLILPDLVPRCREIRDDFISPDQLPQKVGFLSWFSGGLLIDGASGRLFRQIRFYNAGNLLNEVSRPRGLMEMLFI